MSAPELSEAQSALLAEVVEGLRRMDDPEVVDLLAQHPGLDEELAWIRGASQSLDLAGATARAEIAAATGAVLTSAERAKFASLLDRELGQAAPLVGAGAAEPRRPSANRRAFFAAAAGLFVTGAIVWQWWPGSRERRVDRDREPVDDFVMSNDEVTGPRYVPAGETRDVSVFRWPERPARGDYYRVRVLDPTGEVVCESPPLETREWRPGEFDREAIAELPRFEWQLVREVVGGDDRVEATTEVWR